jgi:hypothetical protein
VNIVYKHEGALERGQRDAGDEQHASLLLAACVTIRTGEPRGHSSKQCLHIEITSLFTNGSGDTQTTRHASRTDQNTIEQSGTESIVVCEWWFELRTRTLDLTSSARMTCRSASYSGRVDRIRTREGAVGGGGAGTAGDDALTAPGVEGAEGGAAAAAARTVEGALKKGM